MLLVERAWPSELYMWWLSAVCSASFALRELWRLTGSSGRCPVDFTLWREDPWCGRLLPEEEGAVALLLLLLLLCKRLERAPVAELWDPARDEEELFLWEELEVECFLWEEEPLFELELLFLLLDHRNPFMVRGKGGVEVGSW